MSFPSDLPPGCSVRDIDLASGALIHCDSCPRVFAPKDDETTCPKCKRAEEDGDETH